MGIEGTFQVLSSWQAGLPGAPELEKRMGAFVKPPAAGGASPESGRIPRFIRWAQPANFGWGRVFAFEPAGGPPVRLE